MKENITVKHLSKEASNVYFKEIADIHKVEIKDGFLVRLGTRFLQRLYRYFSYSDNAILLVALQNEKVVGFICTSIDTRKLYRGFILKHGLVSAFMVLPRILTLDNFRKVFEVLSYPRKKDVQDLPNSEILNFCTNSQEQGKGIGKSLFFHMIERMKQQNIHELKIVTGHNQKKAQKFYESVGAEKVYSIEVHKNIKSFVYTYRISKEN